MSAKWLKRIAALLALCMAVGVTGCFGNTEGDNTAETGETADTVESTEEAEDPIKVGYIFHGDAENGGLSAELNSQRLKAASHSDIETVYIDNVNISDFEEAVKVLTEAGCTQIVSGSPIYMNTLTSTAGKYMNIDFISYGATVRSVNIYAYTDKPYQGAYVAGMAAAYNSETEKIGIVADPDLLYSIPVVNAAALGMQLVYSDASMIAAYATQDSEIHDAVDGLVASGCDTIICYTESAEAANYCNSIGVKFIGNMNYGSDAKNYENMLMYFYCAHDSFYLSQFKQYAMDTWEADAYVGTMANGVVNVSEALPAAKDGTQDIISALIPKVSSGSAYIFEGELKDTTGTIKFMQNNIMQEAEIFAMDWYVQGVSILGNYRQPLYELEKNDFEIKH